MQHLYIIRGLPGAGKSTLAGQMKREMEHERLQHVVIVEADQFFVSTNGHKEIYNFDRRFLGAAHDACYGRAMRYLKDGYCVIVANTFSTNKEVNRYIKGLNRTGLESRVRAHVVCCTGKWKSVHNVPARAIEKMRARWEKVDQELFYDPRRNQ